MKKLVVYGVKAFPSQGGTDRVAENLIRQLKDRFHITLYCYKSPEAKTHIPGIEVIEFKPLSSGALGAFVYFLQSALHLIFTRKADLVHVHKTDSAFFIPLLRLRFKVVATSHEAPYKRDKWNALIKLYFHLVERMFISSPNKCTCISQPLTDYYEKKYSKPVLFIPNGINPLTSESFDVQNAQRFLPAGTSLDKPYILFSARRIMKTKGCHTMLDALVKIGYTGQVFIAGELTHNTDYLDELKKIGRNLNMHFLGFVNPLNTLLALVQRAEVFIFPSETEGMSIMLLEVASAGRPIVASDIPENTQVFSNEEVLYFKVSNPTDLADKLQFALNNKTQMESLARKCQEKVYTKYVWANIANTYADVYNTVMS
jgi:glycosyltransferase involved in cell wall biosynthesis